MDDFNPEDVSPFEYRWASVTAAQDKIAEARSFLSDMTRDAEDSKDPTLSLYAEELEKYLDDISDALKKCGDHDFLAERD